MVNILRKLSRSNRVPERTPHPYMKNDADLHINRGVDLMLSGRQPTRNTRIEDLGGPIRKVALTFPP